MAFLEIGGGTRETVIAGLWRRGQRRGHFDLFAERTARPLPPAGEEGKVRSYYSRAYSLRRSYMECGIDLDHRHGGMPWRVTGDCAVACDVRVLEELSLGPWLVALPRTSVLD